MGISALLSPPMANETENVELRLVSEDTGPDPGYVRLVKDLPQEAEDLPPVRLEAPSLAVRLDAKGRDEIKLRSNEPDMRSLVETAVPTPVDPWESQSAEGRAVPWGWVVLVACLFGAAITWSLVNVNSGEEKRKDFVQDALAILEKDNQEEMEATALVETLESVATGFFGSRSVEEMLRYVRHPERVRPLMERYYGEQAPEPKRVLDVVSMEPFTIEKRANFWMVSCELKGQPQTNMLLESLSAKEARVDWETLVCYQPMEWDRFAKTRPGGYAGDFRVYVESDFFHSHEFADADTFDCYRLTALNGEETLYGYVLRGSSLAPRMAELTAGKSGSRLPMILRLHLPDGLDSPRGVVVREIVSPRWLFVDDPGIKQP